MNNEPDAQDKRDPSQSRGKFYFNPVADAARLYGYQPETANVTLFGRMFHLAVLAGFKGDSGFHIDVDVRHPLVHAVYETAMKAASGNTGEWLSARERVRCFDGCGEEHVNETLDHDPDVPMQNLWWIYARHYCVPTTHEAAVADLSKRLMEQRQDLPQGAAFFWEGMYGSVVRIIVAACYPSDQYRNFYRCGECGHDWTDVWVVGVNDDCPECGAKHISPHRTEVSPITNQLLSE